MRNKETKNLTLGSTTYSEKTPKNTAPPVPPPTAIPMSNNKQNSIDWLIEKYTIICGLGSKELMIEHIEKAKAMREKEIKDAYEQGDADAYWELHGEPRVFKNKHEYYKETFE